MYGELRLAGIGCPGDSWVIHLIFAAPGLAMSTADQNRGSEDIGASILDTDCYSIPVLTHARDEDCKDRWRIERISMSITTVSCLCNVLQQLETAFGRMLISLVTKPIHREPIVVQKMSIGSNGILKSIFVPSRLKTPKKFSSPTK